MRINISHDWTILLVASTCLGCAEESPGLDAQNETIPGGFVDLVGVVVEDSCDTKMAAMPAIRQIALGSNASFALDEEGNVWSWGWAGTIAYSVQACKEGRRDVTRPLLTFTTQ